LGLPALLIQGTVPYAPEGSFYTPRYNNHTVYTFAMQCSDLDASFVKRLDAIEKALSLGGETGRAALAALACDGRLAPSRLVPPGGLPNLNAAELPQQQFPMDARRSMLAMGEHLRLIDLFADLSDAEMRILGTFMERVQFAAGDFIVRQGDPGDALYLIESGKVEARLRTASGRQATLSTRGPGDHFGEMALVTGRKRSADVVAVSPTTVLRLDRDAYQQYLTDLAEVREELARTTQERARNSERMEHQA
jgi:hypothetical protein